MTLRLDDEAEEPLPAAAGLQSGAFRPTTAAGSAVAFLSEAPQTTGSAALSAFDGSNPNGTWRLNRQKQIQDNPAPATTPSRSAAAIGGIVSESRMLKSSGVAGLVTNATQAPRSA